MDFCRIIAKKLNGDVEVQLVAHSTRYIFWFVAKIPFSMAVSNEENNKCDSLRIKKLK